MTIPTDPLDDDTFVVHEIGSLAKPEFRVKAKREDPITDEDVDEARRWADQLGIEDEAKLLFSLLHDKREGFTDREQALITSQASLFAVRLQEEAGLDWVYDGEQHRSEMYRYPVTHSEGFEFRGYCRSFDNKYWNKAAVVDEPEVTEPYHTDELDTIQGHAERPVKVPVTGAYTIVDWSFDEHYLREHLHEHDVQPGSPEAEEARAEARNEFVVDVARKLIRPNLEALVEQGARWIQIDEPAVTTHPDEVPLFVEAFNESVKGLTDECRFSTHICFSDYTNLFPHVLELEGCSEFALELANRDPWAKGTDRDTRSGYHLLDPFAEHEVDAAVGLGAVDIHTDELEPPELVADRLRYALDVFDDDPTKVWPCTDCGLRTRSWETSYEKMQRLAEGARIVAEERGIEA